MKRKGFTLIELMVVISIIGLLAAVVLVGMKAARSKARDVQVKSDIRSIANALEMYGLDNGDKYPTASDEPLDAGTLNMTFLIPVAHAYDCTTQTDKVACILINSGYIDKMPVNKAYANTPYIYNGTDGKSYTVKGQKPSDGTKFIAAVNDGGTYSIDDKYRSGPPPAPCIPFFTGNNISFVKKSATELMLAWPAASSCSGIKNYDIVYKKNSGADTSINTGNNSITNNFTMDASKYDFKIYAIGNTGGRSTASLSGFFDNTVAPPPGWGGWESNANLTATFVGSPDNFVNIFATGISLSTSYCNGISVLLEYQKDSGAWSSKLISSGFSMGMGFCYIYNDTRTNTGYRFYPDQGNGTYKFRATAMYNSYGVLLNSPQPSVTVSGMPSGDLQPPVFQSLPAWLQSQKISESSGPKWKLTWPEAVDESGVEYQYDYFCNSSAPKGNGTTADPTVTLDFGNTGDDCFVKIEAVDRSTNHNRTIFRPNSMHNNYQLVET